MMVSATAEPKRRFVFLQGPHGPFFALLAKRLRSAGHDVARIAFNAGDSAFWRGLPLTEYHDAPDAWPEWFEAYCDANHITDIVCYGATRPIHAAARQIAAKRSLTPHVFEEGYLRPYWITYERGGTNAQSPVMDIPIDQMAYALAGNRTRLPRAPDRWGDTRQHVFWGAAYHAALLAGQRRFENFSPHRVPAPQGELPIYARHLFFLPLRRIQRRISTRRVLKGDFPYHVALLQLAHDANFRENGPFPSQRAFVETVMHGFAEGAPPHHHLVFKAHPFEDGREPLRPLIKAFAEKEGLSTRVHLITGGKLAKLLDDAESAVTVNSTAAEQALWRSIPVKAFGQAVYRRPELTSEQPLAQFFTNAQGPAPEAYEVYRRFLLATSQIPGGYYAKAGRQRLLRRLPDLMLASQSTAQALLTPAAAAQHMALVRS